MNDKQSAAINAAYAHWLNDPYFDSPTKEYIANLQDEGEIASHFGPFPGFGVAGIRAPIGAGSSRFNRYVMRKITQAVADVLLAPPHRPELKVVIGYDTRFNSAEIALDAALTLAARGITVYLFNSACPTPQLAFAITYMGATAGLMITASHNPWTDNGCKIYDEQGCQIVTHKTQQLILAIEARQDWHIDVLDEDKARELGLLKRLDHEIADAYYQSARYILLNLPLAQKKGASLSIVYSPLFGSGRVAIKEVLSSAGFTNVFIVPEEQFFREDTTHIPQANPEFPVTFKLAIKYARQLKADLLLLTDPDADRLGVGCRNKGAYKILSGNQVGLLLINYLLSNKALHKTLPPDGVLIRNIVSTPLADRLAASFGVSTHITMVGSSNISAEILRLQQSSQNCFLFGFEESMGYIIGGHCLEKDAVAAAALIAEAALFYRETQQQTLFQALESIYLKFGYYLDHQETISLAEIRAKSSVADWLARLRHLSYREGYTVKELACSNMGGSEHSPFPPPLYLTLGEDRSVIVRPSGTEEKLKLYYSAQAATHMLASSKLATFRQDFRSFLKKAD
ncbi:MAG: phospho-sugar mutase [Firmicutes bacterium]|nr:phospho-sugar mutase [Bacillota bacterium]